MPRQQRSRALVDSILEAAARILGRKGWAKFTTNEVALAAGVSVGSLYQYFPNKLSLAEAIRQRHLEAVMAALVNSERRLIANSPDERIAHLIDSVIAVHSVDRALHRVLLEEVPLLARSHYEAFEREYHQRYRAIVEAEPGMRSKGRDDVAGRVLAAAIEGVVHAAARQDEINSSALRAELGSLVRGYLRERSEAKR